MSAVERLPAIASASAATQSLLRMPSQLLFCTAPVSDLEVSIICRIQANPVKVRSDGEVVINGVVSSQKIDSVVEAFWLRMKRCLIAVWTVQLPAGGPRDGGWV